MKKHAGSEYSWSGSCKLAAVLYLLEPVTEDGEFVLNKWDERTCCRWICRYRPRPVLSWHWYGAWANWAVPELTRAIKQKRRRRARFI